MGGLFILHHYINKSQNILKGGFAMNEALRKQVKELKVYQDISYKELAEYLEIKRNSFYNWLKGYYNFSEEKQKQLQDIINNLKEV